MIKLLSKSETTKYKLQMGKNQSDGSIPVARRQGTYPSPINVIRIYIQTESH